MATLIDGKALAKKIRQHTTLEVARLGEKGIVPGLAVLLVGEDPASGVYVRNKYKACEAAGMESFEEKFPADISEEKLLKHLRELNRNKKVHGILVQLPLPKHLNADTIIAAIDPQKDADGLHPHNLGLFYAGRPYLTPCTPQGVLEMIKSTGIDIEGKDAVVIGRSAIVGRPTATLLTQNDATVTVCHSRTRNLQAKIAAADILVAAVGRPQFVQGAWIKEGAVVIDVGIHRLPSGKLAGDVDFESASIRAGFISPVPGGVGPMTIAMLLNNTLIACKKIEGFL